MKKQYLLVLETNENITKPQSQIINNINLISTNKPNKSLAYQIEIRLGVIGEVAGVCRGLTRFSTHNCFCEYEISCWAKVLKFCIEPK